MIARVYESEVSLWTPDTEAALRQCGLFAAYGADTSFLRFYADEAGNRLSVFGQAAVLHAIDACEEFRMMLTMDPTVKTVRTDADTARLIAEDWHTSFRSEAVMSAPLSAVPSDTVSDLPLKDLYPLLTEVFPDALPPFDEWYADVHHRYRRGLCRSLGVREHNRLVACAMTVAEHADAALIGAVATHPDARGKGYASACVLTLSAMLQRDNKSVMLSPKNEYARALYEKIGFSVIGEWGSVQKG